MLEQANREENRVGGLESPSPWAQGRATLGRTSEASMPAETQSPATRKVPGPTQVAQS